MKITELQINNFGKFHQKKIAVHPGLNVIYGDNETGKSTLHQFITGMLFGMEKQRGRAGKNDAYQQYEPWNSSSYYAGAMRFQVDGKSFRIERNFYHKEKTATLKNELDGEELSVTHGDMEMLLGGMKKSTYENTYCIRQAAVETGKEFSGILQNYFVNASHTGDGDVNLTGAQKKLKTKQRELEQSYRKEWEERKSACEKLQLAGEIAKKDLKQLEQQLEQLKAEGYQTQILWQNPEGIPMENETNPMAEFLQQEQGERQERRCKRGKGIFGGVTLVSAILAGSRLVGKGLAAAISPIFFIEILLLIAGVIGVIYFQKQEEHLRRERKAKEEANRGLRGQKEEIEEKEWTKKPAVVQMLNPQKIEKRSVLSNLTEEIEETGKKSEKEQELERQIAACQLALQMLQKISENVYEDTREQLEGEISGILYSLTGGKYDRITLDDDMNLVVCQEGRTLYPWQLSRGTMEQMYLALRLGAGRFFTQEEPLPVLLDEAFASFDEKRLESALKWLAAQPEQIFLFTCQKREMELLDRNAIPYGKIWLQNI